MMILEKPNYPPYVCISCGLGTGRSWFVSLDLPLDNYFNPVNDGVVFFCNECWESLVTSIAKDVQVFFIGRQPWVGGEFVAPEYGNKDDVVKEVDFSGDRVPSTVATVTHLVPPVNSGTAESSDPESSSSDPATESPTSDDDAGPVQEFRDFFGDGGSDTGEPGV